MSDLSFVPPHPSWARDCAKYGLDNPQDVKRLMIRQFLAALFAPYTDGYIEVRCIMDKGSDRWASAYKPPQQYWLKLPVDEECLDMAVRVCFRAECEGFDVYCGVLPRERHKGTKESVVQGAVLWLDLDFKVMEQAAAADALKKAEAEIVVSSGHGYHAYWFLKDTAKIGEIGVAKFEAKVRGFQQKFGKVDNTSDVVRILRVPGSTNFKDAQNPKPVRLLKPSVNIIVSGSVLV